MENDEIIALTQNVLDLEKEIGQGKRQSIVKNWLKQNLLGKTITTIDGKLIHFNSNDSVSHLSFNARRHHFLASCIRFVPLVFATGEFVGRQISDHSRKDTSIIAFHIYRKWIELENGSKICLEAHAVEREGVLICMAYAYKKAKDEPHQDKKS